MSLPTGSPSRALHPIEGYLVLSIAPLLDFKDIQALRLTSKVSLGHGHATRANH